LRKRALATKLVRREVTRRRNAGHGGGLRRERRGEQLSWRRGNGRRSRGFAALDLSTASFERRSFAGESADAVFKKNLNNYGKRNAVWVFGSAAGNAPQAVRWVASLPGRASRSSPTRTTGTAPVARVSGSGWAETSLGRLDLRSRPRHSAPGNHFGRALARGLRIGRQTGGGFGGPGRSCITSGRRSAARSDHVGPHRLLRAAELPGTRCGDGVRNLELIEPLFAGHGCGRNSVPLHGCDRDADGQGGCLRTWMLRPSLDPSRDQWQAGFS